MADSKDILVDGEGKFSIEDIQKGNAGNSFKENREQVKPWENIDGETYEDVRDDDRIEAVLTSDKNLQFTRKIVEEQVNRYIRLIMPMYSRRVEVEDLNRNFWVIGQTLSAIAAYLFEQQKVTDVHSEYIYLNGTDDTYNNYYNKKFDNFCTETSSSSFINDIQPKIDHFKKLYPNTILIIVPIIRENNYKRNYYSKETYPGVAIYNPNNLSPSNDGWKWIKFSNNNTINIDNYKNNIEAGLEEENDRITHAGYKAISDGSVQEGSSISRYYRGAIRTIPEITNIDISNINNIQFDLTIKLIDAIKDSYENNQPLVATYSASIQQNSPSVDLNCQTKSIQGTNTITTSDQLKGYYLGELLSTKALESSPSPIEYDLKVEIIVLEPIPSSYYSRQQDFYNTLNQGNRKYIFERKIDDKSPDSLTLYIGIVYSDLDNDGDTEGKIGRYYDNTGSLIEDGFYYNDGYTYNMYRENIQVFAKIKFPESMENPPEIDTIEECAPVGLLPTMETKNLGNYLTLEAEPSAWKGGRVASSIFTLTDAYNDRQATQKRQSESQYYYEIFTDTGGKIKDGSKWMIAYTKVTYQYGILPEYYKSKKGNGHYFFINENDEIIDGKMQQGGCFYNQSIGSTPNVEQGHSLGYYDPNTEPPDGWSANPKDNMSNYVSKELLGLPMRGVHLIKAIQELPGNIINITYSPENSSQYSQDPYEVKQANNELIIHYPLNAGMSNFYMGTFRIELDDNSRRALENIRDKKWDNFNIDATEGFYNYYGLVTNVSRTIFSNINGINNRVVYKDIYKIKNGGIELQDIGEFPIDTTGKNSAEIASEKNLELFKIGGNLEVTSVNEDKDKQEITTIESKEFNQSLNKAASDAGKSKLDMYIECLGDYVPDYQKHPVSGKG